MKTNRLPLVIALVAIVSMLLAACQPYKETWTDGSGNKIVVEYIPAPTQQPGQPTPPAPDTDSDSKVEPPAPAPDQATAIPSNITCDGIKNKGDETYVEKDLFPNQSFLGDVEIFINNAWVKAHDDGSGEYTIIRNVGSTNVKVRARWGAGCQNSVDMKFLVNNEFTKRAGDILRVRDIEVNGDNYKEQFFTAPIP